MPATAIGDDLDQFSENGFDVLPDSIPESLLRDLDAALDAQQAGTRNLLAYEPVRQLVISPAMRALVEPVLGKNSFAVRGILFNKLDGANWKVAWHQDSVIAVRERKEVCGWGPWSVKNGVLHVRPTSTTLERMLAVRVHLDNCGEANGPLRVIPGSHHQGLLSGQEVLDWPKVNAVTCTAKRGDALLMRPLLLHASSAVVAPTSRRVIHVEFATDELPCELEWHERVQESHSK